MNLTSKEQELKDILSEGIIDGGEINDYGLRLISEEDGEIIMSRKDSYNFALVCYISMLSELKELLSENNIDYYTIGLGEGMFDMRFMVFINKKHETKYLEELLG